jgi:hypothetical protein
MGSLDTAVLRVIFLALSSFFLSFFGMRGRLELSNITSVCVKELGIPISERVACHDCWSSSSSLQSVSRCSKVSNSSPHSRQRASLVWWRNFRSQLNIPVLALASVINRISSRIRLLVFKYGRISIHSSRCTQLL